MSKCLIRTLFTFDIIHNIQLFGEWTVLRDRSRARARGDGPPLITVQQIYNNI